MHITLISADDEVWARGLRSISAVLREGGHRTTMVFAGKSEAPVDESTIRRLALIAKESEIIGVSSMSRGSGRAKALIAGLRPLGKLLVWGGMHPTLYAEDCVPHADLVCRGEGEGFMLELAYRIRSGRTFGDIRNGAFLSDGRLVLNPLRPLIADIDTLPFPDFSFHNEYLLDASGKFVRNGQMRDSQRVLFSGSRGCNNKCTYCSNSELRALYRGGARYARKMSVPAFTAAVRQCSRTFPRAKEFYFTDEDFFARSAEDMRAFAAIYPSEVGLPFEVMASPRNITDEKMASAVAAGMWRVDVGLESGSERTRREIFNRHISDETQLRSAFAISKHKTVVAYYFLILGNPYEELDDLIGGIDLLQRMPHPFFLRAYNLVFIPGTQLFNRACQDGIIQGLSDSGSEMDFLAGFDHNEYPWKRRNLYLNSLISLMIGKSTRFRIGWVPRRLLPALTHRTWVAYCDRHPRIGELLMGAANCGLKMRRAAAFIADMIFPDRRIIYNVKRFLCGGRLSSSVNVGVK